MSDRSGEIPKFVARRGWFATGSLPGAKQQLGVAVCEELEREALNCANLETGRWRCLPASMAVRAASFWLDQGRPG